LCVSWGGRASSQEKGGEEKQQQLRSITKRKALASDIQNVEKKRNLRRERGAVKSQRAPRGRRDVRSTFFYEGKEGSNGSVMRCRKGSCSRPKKLSFQGKVMAWGGGGETKTAWYQLRQKGRRCDRKSARFLPVLQHCARGKGMPEGGGAKSP